MRGRVVLGAISANPPHIRRVRGRRSITGPSVAWPCTCGGLGRSSRLLFCRYYLEWSTAAARWARDRRSRQKKKKADDTGSASAPGSGSSSEVGSDDGSATEALTSNYDADDEGDIASTAIRDFLSLHREAAAVKQGDRVLGLWTDGATGGSEEWYPGNATKVDNTRQQSVEVTFDPDIRGQPSDVRWKKRQHVRHLLCQGDIATDIDGAKWRLTADAHIRGSQEAVHYLVKKTYDSGVERRQPILRKYPEALFLTDVNSAALEQRRSAAAAEVRERRAATRANQEPPAKQARTRKRKTKTKKKPTPKNKKAKNKKKINQRGLLSGTSEPSPKRGNSETGVGTGAPPKRLRASTAANSARVCPINRCALGDGGPARMHASAGAEAAGTASVGHQCPCVVV